MLPGKILGEFLILEKLFKFVVFFGCCFIIIRGRVVQLGSWLTKRSKVDFHPG